MGIEAWVLFGAGWGCAFFGNLLSKYLIGQIDKETNRIAEKRAHLIAAEILASEKAEDTCPPKVGPRALGSDPRQPNFTDLIKADPGERFTVDEFLSMTPEVLIAAYESRQRQNCRMLPDYKRGEYDP